MVEGVVTENANFVNADFSLLDVSKDFFHDLLHLVWHLLDFHRHSQVLKVPKGGADDTELAGFGIQFKSIEVHTNI